MLNLRTAAGKLRAWLKMRRAVAEARRWLASRHETASVARRDGCFVFAGPGNTLVRRGPIYEPATREALAALCAIDVLRGGGQQIADLGANVGLHTIFLARRMPGARIHAYDPSPQSLRYLRATVEYNRLDNVTIHAVALGASPGEGGLVTGPAESTGDSLRDTGRLGPPHVLRVVQVPIRTLDQEWLAGVRPTVVKMDCEGGEIDILRGAAAMVAGARPLILVELSPLNMPAFDVGPKDVFEWADAAGYRLLTLTFQAVADEGAMRAIQVQEENFILLPKELWDGYVRP